MKCFKLLLCLIFLAAFFQIGCGNDPVQKAIEKAQAFLDKSSASKSNLVDAELITEEQKDNFDEEFTDDEKDSLYLRYNAIKAKEQLDKYFDATSGEIIGDAADRDALTRRWLTALYAEGILGSMGISFMGLMTTFLGTGSSGSGGESDFQIFSGMLPDDLVADTDTYTSAQTQFTYANNTIDDFLESVTVEAASGTIFKTKFATSEDTITPGMERELTILGMFLSYSSFGLATKKYENIGALNDEEAQLFIDNIDSALSVLQGDSGFAGEAVVGSLEAAMGEISDTDSVNAFLAGKTGVTYE